MAESAGPWPSGTPTRRAEPRRLWGGFGISPVRWLQDPPATEAQRELCALLSADTYSELVRERHVRVMGSAGGQYSLWGVALPFGWSFRRPRVFDWRRGRWLCVSLDPKRRGRRAWEDEWMGLILWIRHAEHEVLEVANPMDGGLAGA